MYKLRAKCATWALYKMPIVHCIVGNIDFVSNIIMKLGYIQSVLTASNFYTKRHVWNIV